MEITFEVEGTPAPKGSKIRTRYGMRESSRRVGPWAEAVKAAAMVAGDAAGLFDALNPPYRVDVWFYISRPRTTRSRYPVAPTIGDLDKLTRAVGDSLTQSGLIQDDRFITELFAKKMWAGENETPGAVIRVTELE